MAKSQLEQTFLSILDQQAAEINMAVRLPQREFRFHPSRKWRFDFAWPASKVAIEIDGGGMAGRHGRMGGQVADADKHNAAVLLGWKVLRFTGVHLRDPATVFEVVMTALGAFENVHD